MNKFYNELKQLYKKFEKFNEEKVPLCAAETYISDFVRQGLSSDFEGKYIQGYKNRIIEKDNIGSNYIYELLSLTEKICNDLYHAKYVDSRTLSGMNCMAILIMAIVDKSSTVLITTKECGGHPSLANILDNLGIRYLPIPYDFEKFEINYSELNKILLEQNISFVIFCQSDIISQPDFSKINLPFSTGLIYDASQTLGLIAANLLDNPLCHFNNSLLIGGTHKTLPGPTCGIIMTNNDDYIKKIDFIISPTLLRNIQPNNIAALCLALIEQAEVGVKYQKTIVTNANILGHKLTSYGIDVVKLNNELFTKTHQLFVCFDEHTTNLIYERAIKYNITLNKRISKLYTGIRIGVQEITRYNYSESDLDNIAKLIYLLSCNEEKEDTIHNICTDLSHKKKPYFILDDIFMV